MVQIRYPSQEELGFLPDIQQKSRALFAGTGYERVLTKPTLSLKDFCSALDEGRLWVSVDECNRPIGFAVMEIIGGCVHLEQLSVVPEYGGRGVGRALVNHVITWASEHQYPGVTLVTYVDIPWNAPFYEHCGFEPLKTTSLNSEQGDVLQEEAKRGVDLNKRVFMLRRTTVQLSSLSPVDRELLE